MRPSLRAPVTMPLWFLKSFTTAIAYVSEPLSAEHYSEVATNTLPRVSVFTDADWYDLHWETCIWINNYAQNFLNYDKISNREKLTELVNKVQAFASDGDVASALNNLLRAAKYVGVQARYVACEFLRGVCWRINLSYEKLTGQR